MLRFWPWPIDISWPAEFSQKVSNLSWYTQKTVIIHSASLYSLHAICMLLATLNTIYIYSSPFLQRSSTVYLPLGSLDNNIFITAFKSCHNQQHTSLIIEACRTPHTRPLFIFLSCKSWKGYSEAPFQTVLVTAIPCSFNAIADF